MKLRNSRYLQARLERGSRGRVHAIRWKGNHEWLPLHTLSEMNASVLFTRSVTCSLRELNEVAFIGPVSGTETEETFKPRREKLTAASSVRPVGAAFCGVRLQLTVYCLYARYLADRESACVKE